METVMNTDKWGCREIASALAAFGVRHVVTSPGSRNAPLIMATARYGALLQIHSVIDERSAAFIALGIGIVSGSPVALICTSGSAMLNYGPAIAEALYRHIPLIVITADRPLEWIDQDDSQTIRQPGAFSNIVKASYAVKGEAAAPTEQWYVNRTLNDAMLCATTSPCGPVHINVALSAPLANETAVDSTSSFREIALLQIPDIIPNDMARRLAAYLCGRKVLVVGGFYPPHNKLSKAVSTLSTLPNVAVMAEGLANLHCSGNIIRMPDAAISRIEKNVTSGNFSTTSLSQESLRPDVLVTFGGALVSASLKRFLRTIKPREHWHVSHNSTTTDCFMSLSQRIDMSPEGFFPKLSTAMQHLTRIGENHGLYASLWQAATEDTTSRPMTNDTCWNARSVVGHIINAVPTGWNLQLSNGMSVRYALSYPLVKFHRVDCNRGVSGIDGCVSTAVGASLAYNGTTLLITGDMSLQYDIAALSSNLLRPRLKIVVLNNGGGGIFKYVDTTAQLPETPGFIHCKLNLPLDRLAAAYGFTYLKASDFSELKSAVKELVSIADSPVILEVFTDSDTDALIMKEEYL